MTHEQIPPQPPQLIEPATSWMHSDVYIAVRNALKLLPGLFSTELQINGVLAPDLFTFNTSLGATIETKVVTALNTMRGVWDRDQRYASFTFVRRAQSFPDVVLRSRLTGEILFGIELKGWYVLAKEREPSFRYKVTPAACAEADLLAVFPWALSQVISGTPVLFEPFITGARYAAEYRNWHWQYGKRGENNAIRLSENTDYYPVHADAVSDQAVNDKGGNFGRFARTGLMDAYMATLFEETLLSGIPVGAWQRFLSVFSEDRTFTETLNRVDRLFRHLSPPALTTQEQAETEEQIQIYLNALIALLRRSG